MKRLKTLFKKLLLLGISGLLALVVLELLLRWRESRSVAAMTATASESGIVPSEIPGLHYTLKPGASNAHAAFNSLGFNMAERSSAKPEGTWRIMVVGDSVTQGVGADKRDDAYPNRVDALLRSSTGGAGVEVWNCGTGGHNVDQVFLMLSRIVTNHRPDAVIYGFCFNDNWGPNLYVSGQAGRPPGTDARMGFLDAMKQLRVVTQGKLIYDNLYYAARGYLPVFVDQKISYPSWVAMKARIAEMRDFCASNGWPFAVNIVPMPQFVHVSDEKNLALHDLRAFLETNRIAFCDATPVLRERRSESLYVERDTHPNSRGYELIAENLAGWIVTNRATFLPPP